MDEKKTERDHDNSIVRTTSNVPIFEPYKTDLGQMNTIRNKWKKESMNPKNSELVRNCYKEQSERANNYIVEYINEAIWTTGSHPEGANQFKFVQVDKAKERRLNLPKCRFTIEEWGDLILKVKNHTIEFYKNSSNKSQVFGFSEISWDDYKVDIIREFGVDEHLYNLNGKFKPNTLSSRLNDIKKDLQHIVSLHTDPFDYDYSKKRRNRYFDIELYDEKGCLILLEQELAKEELEHELSKDKRNINSHDVFDSTQYKTGHYDIINIDSNDEDEIMENDRIEELEF